MIIPSWPKIVFAILIFAAFSKSALAVQTTGFQSIFELADGRELEAQLRSIDDESIKYFVDEEEKLVPLDAVARINFSEKVELTGETSKGIALIDGTELQCKSFKVKGRELIGVMECETEFNVSTRLVDFALLVSGNDPKFQKEWKKTTQIKRESDALVVSRDQKLQMVDGVVGDVTADAVTFTVGERTAEVKRERLAGLLFYRRIKEEFPPASFVFELADGSRIQSRSLTVKDQIASVVSNAGAKFEINANAISSVDFSEGRSVSLTDLDPASNEWEPLLTNSDLKGKLKQFSLARLDKSFNGKKLSILTVENESDSLTRREFSNGFAIQGGGKLSFLLAKQYRQLTGTIGFDPDANSTGVVKLVIQVDGSNRLEKVLDASKLTKPLLIDIDLVDASRIVFIVHYHDRRNVGDILHAVELKLHR